jgi:SAM-dependent methyltransferase
MPFENGYFNAAVSALVLNFIPDREKAIEEMRRVVQTGGIVAAYVWDFAGGGGINQHLNAVIQEMQGADAMWARNGESTTQEKLAELFKTAGLNDVETRAIEISVMFRDFDDYWQSNTGFTSPTGNTIKAFSDEKRGQLKQMVKSKLPIDDNGVISYMARVNAVQGRV